MKKIIELFKKYEEIISYLFWGGCTTVVNWLSYSLFVIIFQTGNNLVDIILANGLSWICAVAFAFITNKLWVFKSKSFKREVVLKELGLFVLARVGTGAIEWIGVPGLVKLGLDQGLFGIKGAVSKILVSVIVVLLNYVFSKLWIFKKKESK